MPATLKKVRSGDPLVIPAATFNAFIDVAQDFQQRQRSAEQDRYLELRQTGIVLIRNESGADRERFDVLGVAGTIVRPSDNADAFKERVALKGTTPGSEHAGRFAVLLEPLAANEVGRACVAGVCVVKVRMNDEGHTFAEARSGQATMLDSAASGTACLLYVQPPGERDDPQIAWTVARLGGGGGGATVERLVRVKKTGGAGGNAYNPPSWTYAIFHHTPPTGVAWDDDTNRLDPGPLQPELNHRTTGVWTAAPDGSLARAALVIDNGVPTWHLLDCAEAPVTEFCNVGS